MSQLLNPMLSPILRSPEMASERRLLNARRTDAERRAAASPAIQDADQDAAATSATSLASATDSSREMETRQIERQQEQLQTELEQAGKRAYEEGHEAGFRTGETEGREAYTTGLQQLEELTQNLNSSIQKSLEESEDMMVAIVYESVCKIIGDALATREGVLAVVKEALGRVRGKSSVIIRVNPIDLELIEESAAFGVVSETDWRADDSIPMGGCLIESEYGTLDARIDTQLNQLKRVLLAARHKPVVHPDSHPDMKRGD